MLVDVSSCFACFCIIYSFKALFVRLINFMHFPHTGPMNKKPLWSKPPRTNPRFCFDDSFKFRAQIQTSSVGALSSRLFDKAFCSAWWVDSCCSNWPIEQHWCASSIQNDDQIQDFCQSLGCSQSQDRSHHLCCPWDEGFDFDRPGSLVSLFFPCSPSRFPDSLLAQVF